MSGTLNATRYNRGYRPSVVRAFFGIFQHIIAQHVDFVIAEIKNVTHGRGIRKRRNASVHSAFFEFGIGHGLRVEPHKLAAVKTSFVKQGIMRMPRKIDHVRVFVKHAVQAFVPPYVAAVHGVFGCVVSKHEHGTVGSIGTRRTEFLCKPHRRFAIACRHTRTVGGRRDEMVTVYDKVSKRRPARFFSEKSFGKGTEIVVVVAHNAEKYGKFIVIRLFQTTHKRSVGVFPADVADVARKKNYVAPLRFQRPERRKQVFCKRTLPFSVKRRNLRVGQYADTQFRV